jgi:hypothetical protein
MGRRKRKKRHTGHYCWSCDRYRANERFSGRGHGRHLCRECAKLGSAELHYRQTVRNIERWMAYQSTVPRKRRGFVQQLLGHEDLRLRAWAEELLTGVPLDAQDEYEEIEPDDLFDE